MAQGALPRSTPCTYDMQVCAGEVTCTGACARLNWACCARERRVPVWEAGSKELCFPRGWLRRRGTVVAFQGDGVGGHGSLQRGVCFVRVISDIRQRGR